MLKAPLGKAGIVAAREYLARIRSKGFWIATLVMPLVMAALVLLPGLFADRAGSSQDVVIAGGSEEFFARLNSQLESVSDGGRFAFRLEHRPAATSEELDRQILAGELDAWVELGADPLAAQEIKYHAESTSNLITQRALSRVINRALREARLTAAGHDPDDIAALIEGVDLTPVQVTAGGEQRAGGFAAFTLAFFLIFSLYFGIVMYGQQVLNGVLEEKSSRVVEVMLAAVTPTEMMLGKLAGICGAALTQMAVWLTTALIILSPGLLAGYAMLPEGVDLPILPLSVVFNFFGFFVLGFIIYASFYAMLGAAFNSQQEAQQMAFVGVVPLIIPMLVVTPVIDSPDSTFSVVMSLIPPFTPLLMVLRIAVKTPPAWQIALAYLLTTCFALFIAWLAARIYRVGILMYGKKPTFAELWRWVRH